METLKTGSLAYLDTFSGLVPCKVLSVKGPKERPSFDLGFGPARVSIKVTVEVTEDVKAYRKGEIIESNSVRVVPRKAIKNTQFSSRILPYKVEEDKE